METLRTPPERFRELPDYAFGENYAEVGDALRLHYVDEGPQDGSPVLMLHGEPTWSYLYRHLVPVFADAGMRALAPDLIGFGKSDKPTRAEDYSYQAHLDWITAWFLDLDLHGVTLVCQDWGSLIGLRLAMENVDRFDRIVVANGFLPTGDHDPGIGFKTWRAFARYTPVLPISRIVDFGTKRRLTRAERAAYDAPFPDRSYKAGARIFPQLVPTTPTDPAAPANRAAWDTLGTWEKPFLTLFGKHDPILSSFDEPLRAQVPGSAGQPHARLDGSHFVQEDAGVEIARRTLEWIAG